MKPREAQHVIALRKHLDRHDEVLAKSRARYKAYVNHTIESLEFQNRLVEQALATKGHWSAELATGIGKTIISAKIALEKLKEGSIIYVCSNSTALGDAEAGIINKFHRVFLSGSAPGTYGTHKRSTYALGEVNDLSLANDVSFMSPGPFVCQLRQDPAYAERLLSQTSCLIIDEAHHFPLDDANDLKIYGEVFKIAEKVADHGLVVSMTGTWGRLDRKTVMGREEPDVRLTVQDAVDLRRCPEIYAVQVILDLIATTAKSHGDLYSYHLRGAEREDYYDAIAECMSVVYKKYPVPFAAFARTQKDAKEIATRFNVLTKRTFDNGVAVLTSRTRMKKRRTVIERIKTGKQIGYITCAVGEEALDLPPLEVVHLIRRTRSITRNAQAVGRSLRLHEGKQRALIIDYQMMVQSILEKFIGLNIDDFPLTSNSRITEVRNGGPLVVQEETQEALSEAKLVGLTMAEERALVVRQNMSPREKEVVAQREREEAERKAREIEDHYWFEKMREAFLRTYQGWHQNPAPIVEFLDIPLDSMFPDAKPITRWWPTATLAERVSDFEDRIVSNERWEVIVHEPMYLMHPLGKAAMYTMHMLRACDEHLAPNNKDRHEDDVYDVSLPVAVIIGAVIQVIKKALPNDRKWERREAKEGNDYLEGLRQTLELDAYRKEVQAISKARSAIGGIFQHYGVLQWEWHHSQTETLPIGVNSELLKLFRIKTPEDLGTLSAVVWSLNRTHYQLVRLTPQKGVRPHLEDRIRRLQDKHNRQKENGTYGAVTKPKEPTKKELILARAKNGDRLTWDGDKALMEMFLHYIRPTSKCYDRRFVEDIRSIAPSWLAHSRHYNTNGDPINGPSTPRWLNEPERSKQEHARVIHFQEARRRRLIPEE